MLNIAEINEPDEFLELGNRWNTVLERSREKNVFLTWEYLSTYWKHFGKGKKLRILVVRDQNHIVAVAPLRQSRYSFAGSLHYNVIEPLGYRGLTPEGADYTGLIIAEKVEAKCLQLFLNYLVVHNNWDFIYLMDFPESSIDIDMLARISKDMSLGFELEERAICPYVSIPGSMDAFMNKLSGQFRYNLRRYTRKLERDYKRVKFVRYDEIGSVEEAMSIYFKLHQKRWRLMKKKPGVFSTQEVRSFYIDVAKLFADCGWLALYFLTIDDKPIAGLYNFEFGEKMYGALSGFDPDYSRYSVGNIIFAKIIETCIQKRLKEFDFLKGDEFYKFRYTSEFRRNLGIRFANKKFTSNLYRFGIRAIKQMKIDELLERFS